MTTAFAIKHPQGDILVYSVTFTRKICVKRFIGDSNTESWRDYYKYGWRCVKVQITEIKKEDK